MGGSGSIPALGQLPSACIGHLGEPEVSRPRPLRLNIQPASAPLPSCGWAFFSICKHLKRTIKHLEYVGGLAVRDMGGRTAHVPVKKGDPLSSGGAHNF